MQAKVERLKAELARLNSALITSTSTNANKVTENAISPSALSTTGVDPDAETSETGPPKDSNVAGRTSSSKASLLKGVESDTARTETVSPHNANVTERAIPPMASLSQPLDPATVQTETGSQSRVNHAKLTAEGVVASQTTPIKNTVSAKELVPSPDQHTPRVGSKLTSRTAIPWRMLQSQRMPILRQP